MKKTNKEIDKLKKKLEESYEKLEDNKILKEYYAGGVQIEEDILNIIKTYERQILLLMLFEEM